MIETERNKIAATGKGRCSTLGTNQLLFVFFSKRLAFLTQFTYILTNFFCSSSTGQMMLVVRHSLQVQEAWGSNSETIKSLISCQCLATAATLIVWALSQSLGDGHRSLVTLEGVLSEYNEDLIILFPHQLHAFCF